MSRIPQLTPADLNDTQRAMYDSIVSGPRTKGRVSGSLTTPEGALLGPFNPWLHTPAIGDSAQAIGHKLRFEGELSGKLRELGILAVAQTWTSDYEWYAHARIGLKEGWSEAAIESLRKGECPAEADASERAAYAFARELLEHHHVSDASYKSAHTLLGNAATAELVCLLGYYVMVSMTLNTFQVPLPEGESVSWD